jgi:hypothetical protein
MRFDMREVGNGEVLAGSLKGRQVLSELISLTRFPNAAEACFLDFVNVEVATGSFLRESVVEYRRLTRGKRSTIYPVVANASDEILEDLDLVLRLRNDAMLVCDLDPQESVSNGRVLGHLEPVQRKTLDTVTRMGVAATPELVRADNDESGVGITAWNNRLASLVSKGLLFEERSGRAKSYRPIWGVA